MLMVTELQTGLRSTTEQLVQLQKRFIAQMNAKEAVEKVERYAAAKLRRELAAAERAKQEERRRRRESADQKKHAAEAVKAEARWLEETERMEREAKQRMSTTKEVDPPLSPAENVVKDEQAGPLTFAQLMARNAQPAEPREGKLQDRSKLKPNPKPAIAVAGSPRKARTRRLLQMRCEGKQKVGESTDATARVAQAEQGPQPEWVDTVSGTAVYRVSEVELARRRQLVVSKHAVAARREHRWASELCERGQRGWSWRKVRRSMSRRRTKVSYSGFRTR